MIQQFHSWVYIQKKTKTLIWKDTCTAMFIAALFTIAKTWKQPASINRWMDKLDVVYIHTHTHTQWILLSHNKEWNSAICNTMDGPREYYAKWNQADRERQILYVISCMWNLKNKTNDVTKQKQTHRYREQTSGYQWGEGSGRGKIGVWD